ALPRTGVADVRAGPVAGEPGGEVGVDPVQSLALGALPGIHRVEVGETRRPIELRAPVGVLREHVQAQGDQRQEEPIPRREQAHASNAAHSGAPTGCFGSVTSVKRISSGSSITTRFTVYRTPR